MARLDTGMGATVLQAIKAALPSFLTEAALARRSHERALASEDEIEARRAMAELGGVHRRWRRALVQLLTEHAFEGMATSRQKVREWQKEAFGRAVSSGELARYAVASRAGGGRSGFVAPAPEVMERVRALYAQHRDALHH